VLVLGAVAALSAASPAAAAGTPCGKKVLGDWFDNGRIDRIYPLHCYEDAINQIPPDLRDYANAEDVITRALQSALHGKVGNASSCDPSPDGSANDCATSGGSGGGGGQGGGSGGGSGDPSGGGGTQAAPDVNTSGPSSVPIPLLVLGGLSLALLAAGGLGYLSRRRQAANANADAGSDDFDQLS
jgi:hypothetical protein